MNIFEIYDINKYIMTFISDTDFINFIMVSKYHYHNFSLFKDITRKYRLSKIINRYNFTNIIYDAPDWNIAYLPKHVKKISFIDEFNGALTDIIQLSSLRKINIGIFFTQYESIVLLTYLNNYQKMIIKIVSNIISINNNYLDVDVYFNRLIPTPYIRTFTNRCKNNIWLRKLNNNIDYSKNTLLEIINDLYEDKTKNCAIIKHIVTNCIIGNSFIDIIFQFPILNLYVEMYYDLENKDNIHELACFLQEILLLNDLFLTKLENKLCSKYNVLSMNEYVKLCNQLE